MADAAWLAARDPQAAPLGLALDRQITCLVLRERALSHTLASAASLSWEARLSLARVLPQVHADQLLCGLAEEIDPLSPEQCTMLVDALARQGAEAALAAVGAALVRRGLLVLAQRALAVLVDPAARVRLAAQIAGALDVSERRALAEGTWRRVASAAPDDLLALCLRMVPLWPPGDPEALRRAHGLAHQLERLSPEQLARPGHDDLRLLMAQAWATHGDLERARGWYRAMGDARHDVCAALARALPESMHLPLYAAALEAALVARRLARRAGEPTAPLPVALRFLEGIDPDTVAVLAARAEAGWSRTPMVQALWALGFLPWLAAEQAQAVWDREVVRFAAWTEGEAVPELDDLLEALIRTLPHVSGGEAALLPWLQRWPQPEPLSDLAACWPDHDLRTPLAVLLARADVVPDGPWTGIIAALVARDPSLWDALSPAWSAALGGPPQPAPVLPVTPDDLTQILRGLSPEEQAQGVRIYAEELADWGESEQSAFLAHLRTPEAAPSPDVLSHRVWQVWVDAALEAVDLKALRQCLPLFSARADAIWLSRHLARTPGRGFALWLAFLREQGDVARVRDALLAALEQEGVDAERRTSWHEALDAEAAAWVRRRAPLEASPLADWLEALPLLSPETCRQLWERRALSFGPCVAPVEAADLALAVRLGGVERLRAALRAMHTGLEASP